MVKGNLTLFQKLIPLPHDGNGKPHGFTHGLTVKILVCRQFFPSQTLSPPICLLGRLRLLLPIQHNIFVFRQVMWSTGYVCNRPRAGFPRNILYPGRIRYFKNTRYSKELCPFRNTRRLFLLPRFPYPPRLLQDRIFPFQAFGYLLLMPGRYPFSRKCLFSGKRLSSLRKLQHLLSVFFLDNMQFLTHWFLRLSLPAVPGLRWPCILFYCSLYCLLPGIHHCCHMLTFSTATCHRALAVHQPASPTVFRENLHLVYVPVPDGSRAFTLFFLQFRDSAHF